MQDLPTYFFDPSFAGTAEDGDDSLTEPRAELNKPDRWTRRWPPFITIVGAQDDKAEAEYLDQLRADARRLQFILDLLQKEGIDGLKKISYGLYGPDRDDIDDAMRNLALKKEEPCQAAKT